MGPRNKKEELALVLHPFKVTVLRWNAGIPYLSGRKYAGQAIDHSTTRSRKLPC